MGPVVLLPVSLHAFCLCSVAAIPCWRNGFSIRKIQVELESRENKVCKGENKFSSAPLFSDQSGIADTPLY